jgi:two-component system, NarL family, response regulator DegU
LDKIILVSPISILVEEIYGLLHNEYPHKRIYCENNLDSDFCFNKHDILMIYIHTWDSSLLLHLKKLQAKEVKIIIWFNSSQKDIAVSYLKEGFHGFLPHDVGKKEIIRTIEALETNNYYIHYDLISNLYTEYLKMRQPAPVDSIRHDIQLTNREWEILKQMTEGYSNEKISQNLFITISTVKNHVSSILKKLHVNSRNAAIVKAMKNRWVVK